MVTELVHVRPLRPQSGPENFLPPALPAPNNSAATRGITVVALTLPGGHQVLISAESTALHASPWNEREASCSDVSFALILSPLFAYRLCYSRVRSTQTHLFLFF